MFTWPINSSPHSIRRRGASNCPTGRTVLFSDTVGFIQKLPVTLVAAFRATLEEIAEADLLLHVVDVSHPRAWPITLKWWKTPWLSSTRPVFRSCWCSTKSTVVITARRLIILTWGYRGVVRVSAVQGTGLDDLRELVTHMLLENMVDVEVLVPYAQGELLSLIHSHGIVLGRDAYGAGCGDQSQSVSPTGWATEQPTQIKTGVNTVSRGLRLLLKVLLFPVNVVRWIGRLIRRALGRLFAPWIRKFDSSPYLSNLINSLSSSMATQRGLPLVVGTGILILSLFAHWIVLIILVSSESFSRNLYWLCIPFTLMHVGILAGFTGAMLAIPLGQGYKDK